MMAGQSPQVQQAPQVAVEEAGTRLYVTQLTPAVDEEILRVYFTYFGQVRDVYIPADYTTGLKKPFAFVTMFSAECNMTCSSSLSELFLAEMF